MRKSAGGIQSIIANSVVFFPTSPRDRGSAMIAARHVTTEGTCRAGGGGPGLLQGGGRRGARR